MKMNYITKALPLRCLKWYFFHTLAIAQIKCHSLIFHLCIFQTSVIVLDVVQSIFCRADPLHYTTHDTRMTHGHRKLRLAEDFEMLRLTPDFETLRLTCDFKTLRLTPARRPPDAHQTPARRNFLKSGVRRKILKCCVWHLILKPCAWRVISKHCAWHQPGARQTPARRQPDATFWNQASGARQTPARRNVPKSGVRREISKYCVWRPPDAMFRNQAPDARFQNHVSDVIFCDHASDMQSESSYVARVSYLPGKSEKVTLHFLYLSIYNKYFQITYYFPYQELISINLHNPPVVTSRTYQVCNILWFWGSQLEANHMTCRNSVPLSAD